MSRKLIFLGLFLVICLIHTVGVGLNFTPYKFPNDGAAYVSVAESLASLGELKTYASIPIKTYGVYQNSIVYLLAACKLLLGSLWPIGYILIISLLWTIALIQFYKLSFLVLSDRAIAIILSALVFLNFEVLMANSSFLNESVYLPCFLALTCFFLRNPDATSYLFRIAAVTFLLVGLTFRYIHVNVLVALLAYALLYDRKKLPQAILLSLLSGVLFLGYVSWIGPGTRDGMIIRETLVNLVSLNINDLLCRLTFLPQIFVLFLNPEKIVGMCNPHIVILGSLTAPFVIFGLLRLREKLPKSCGYHYLYFCSTALFLFLMPIRADRYALTLLPFVLLGIASTFTHFGIKRYLRPALIALVLVTFGLISFVSFLYFSGKSFAEPRHYPNTYLFLSVHEKFKERHNPREFLIYSIEPYLSYWAFNERICEVGPTECVKLKFNDARPHPIVYFGTRKSFEKSDLLVGKYKISSSYVEPKDNLSAWEVTKIDNGKH